MGDVVFKEFRRRKAPPEHHKGWPSSSAAQTDLDVNGHNGERRLAEREREVRRSEKMDGVMQKFFKREELRRSLRVIESDIDRNR
jgi:hypothetical protein